MPAATKNAKPAPAPQAPSPGKEVADPKLYSYYRVRKLTGFLSELLEVQVDESQVKPKVVGKQDDRGLILDRARNVLNDNAKAGK
jgi:hypothetical protein